MSNLSENQKIIEPEKGKETRISHNSVKETMASEKMDLSTKFETKNQISEQIRPSVSIKDEKERPNIDEGPNHNKVSEFNSEEQAKKTESEVQSGLTLEFIQSKWTEFVHYISSHKPSVGTILDSCMVQSIDQKQINISLFDQPKFNFSVLERNKHWITHSLEQIISYPVIIKFILKEKKNILETNTNSKTKKNSLQKNGKTIVSQIIDVFDGEIIN